MVSHQWRWRVSLGTGSFSHRTRYRTRLVGQARLDQFYLSFPHLTDLSSPNSKRSQPNLDLPTVLFKPTTSTHKALFFSLRKSHPNFKAHLSKFTPSRRSQRFRRRSELEDQRWKTSQTFDQRILQRNYRRTYL